MEKIEYAIVASDESGSSYELPENKTDWAYTWMRYIFLGLIVVLCLAIATGASILAWSLNLYSCSNPHLRIEWRSLEPEEKQNYIQAIQCLQNTFSSLTGIGTLYDDFVYVHMSIGRETHGVASFLPWHRAFLHIYETTLAEKCGYQGPMPYWAWELDWQNLESSPVWDSAEGFGGDGDPNGELTLGNGRCVIDGPFKNRQRLYFDRQILPHCLGRAFVNIRTKQKGTLFGDSLSPKQIAFLNMTNNYDDFRNRTEVSIHNAIHQGIKGDFATLVSANDPIFWLHHAQLDRLWWQWQQEDPARRLTQYYGLTSNMSSAPPKPATIDDKLTFLGMWEDIKVSDVLHTNGELLCYKY